jgi:molybdate/tungstate transport system substrate-binding protein
MLRIETRCVMRGAALLLLPFAAQCVCAQSSCAPSEPQLIIYHAGSLSAAFTSVEKLFTQQTGICVVDVAGGSIDAARKVTAGGQPCDIFASADYAAIDRLLKPAHVADYNILFGEGAMVLAYTTESKNAATVATPNAAFSPPRDIPEAAPDWYSQLTQPGVAIAGSHPFLDPGGYRADLIFQLAQDHYGVPNLYNTLLSHYSISKASDKLGETYDYQFIYEHSAIAAANADATKTYRFVRLPDDISLSATALNGRYARRGITIPGLQLPGATPTVRIQASRVTWGLTVLRTARNGDTPCAFWPFCSAPKASRCKPRQDRHPSTPRW